MKSPLLYITCLIFGLGNFAVAQVIPVLSTSSEVLDALVQDSLHIATYIFPVPDMMNLGRYDKILAKIEAQSPEWVGQIILCTTTSTDKIVESQRQSILKMVDKFDVSTKTVLSSITLLRNRKTWGEILSLGRDLSSYPILVLSGNGNLQVYGADRSSDIFKDAPQSYESLAKCLFSFPNP